MNIKLTYILPDLAACKRVRSALISASIDDEAIHFVAKSGTQLDGLKVASNLESTNMVREGEIGVAYGMLFGLLCGIYVLTFPLWITESPAWYSDSPWYVILLVLTLFGGVSMAIAATILGVNIFNKDLKKYQHRIEQGEILMIISLPLRIAYKMRQTIQNSMLDKQVKTTMLNQMKV